MTDITNNDLDLEIIPYTNKKNYTKTDLEKFHIVNKDGNIIRNKICNVYAPFGRQTQSENKIKSNKNLTQHRLNIGFSNNHIKDNIKPYRELHKFISEIESYFSSFDELKKMDLQSNIINRDKYGIIIRFHLKTNRNHTTTPLIQGKFEDPDSFSDTEWIAFDKNKEFDFEFHPDSLWIDHKNNKYGVSMVIDKVIQTI